MRHPCPILLYWPYPFLIPAHRDPTHPVPPLIGDGTPVSICILICSNGEPAEGPLSFLKYLSWGGIYKFWERMRTLALGLDCKNDYHCIMKFFSRLLLLSLLGWGSVSAQSNLPACQGSDVSRWNNCVGTYTRTNGESYVGEFKNGQRNGQGIYSFGNGTMYVGEYKDGIWNGQGTQHTSNGSIIKQGILADESLAISLPVQEATAPNQEIDRLRAEADEAKRKQVEAEAQLRLAQQTIQTPLTLASVKGFGLSVTNITDAQKSQLKIKGGIRVESLIEPAIRAGLREGDVIFKVGNIEVSQVKDFAAALSKLDKSKPVHVLFRREELTRFALIRPNQSGDADVERNLAEQKAKEQQRLTEEAQIKEQQRLALEAFEISRLRAETVESKRKQEEAEAQLKLAQQAAQPNKPALSSVNERRVALVIGNATYKVNPLKNPVNDSTDMARSLRSVGFDVIEANNTTLFQMREATRRFADKLGNSDVGLVYYSGHGVEVKGKNYLIPVNADIKREYEVVDQAFDASQFLEMMDNIRGPNNKRVNILIVDACRNNELQKSWRSTNNGLARMDAPGGTFISFATAPGRVAADGVGRNSPYTKHLLQALKQPNVPIEQVFKVVRRNVMEETKGEQIPWENSSLVGDFYFTVQR